jgi:uncharacterized membrane protein YbaN (DUF454 family)
LAASFFAKKKAARLGSVRGLVLALGFFFTGLGFLGGLLPVLPSTPFFLLAAYFFSRSSPRLEAWLLSLPRVGALIRDYREGRGMSRRTKAWAALLILLGTGFSLSRLSHPGAWALLLGLVAYALYFIWKRVPTQA